MALILCHFATLPKAVIDRQAKSAVRFRYIMPALLCNNDTLCRLLIDTSGRVHSSKQFACRGQGRRPRTVPGAYPGEEFGRCVHSARTECSFSGCCLLSASERAEMGVY